jgi:hypothetical protein
MRTFVEVSDDDNNGVPDWQDDLGALGIATSTPLDMPTTTDPTSHLGTALIRTLVNGYLSLKQSDEYTSERGERLAQTIASAYKAPATFVPYTPEKLAIIDDSTEAGILRYRADMRSALLSMVDLEAEPEFAIFARYIHTNDPVWLERLSAAAANYHTAASKALSVPVPREAAEEHLRTVNAIGKYAETLDRLVRFANDPLALLALLRTYNESEREMFLAFDALAKFYVHEVSQ